MKKNLADWASLAEIIAAGAVVVSLLFVGLQIRNSADQTELNTQAIQMSAYQVLVGQINDMSLLSIEHPDVSSNQRLPLEDLSPTEKNQILNFMVIRARHADLAFYQYSLGLLTDEQLTSVMGPLAAVWCTPAFTSIWRGGVGSRAAAAFKEYVDTGIAESCSQ